LLLPIWQTISRYCGHHSHISGTRKASCKYYNSARKSARREFDDIASPSDSSAGEDEPNETSAAPEPDAEITYSFDADRGPGGGSQVLSIAVSKAVERFENRETEKIAEEYEFVDSKDGYVADANDYDGDFEIIDDVNLL
jgi:hypothetical protein